MKKALVKTANAYRGGKGEQDGMEGLSVKLGMGRFGLRNRIYELKMQGIYLSAARQMMRETGTTFIAEAMAKEAGGVFIQLPSIDGVDQEDLHEKLMKLHADIGALSKDYFAATRDDEIDQREKDQLLGQRDKVCQTLHEWLALSFSIYCRN